MHAFVLTIALIAADGNGLGATYFFKTQRACAEARDRDVPAMVAADPKIVAYAATCAPVVKVHARGAV